MTTIVTRSGKGSSLSWGEMDANFTNLNTAKLETGHPATDVANTPNGSGIAATNVQAAINELDTEKSPKASPTFTGTVTSPQNYNVSGSYGALQVAGVDVLRFGADNSGQLAGFRNILINGKLSVNQRGVTIAAAANGSYGPDRWKKVDASNMTQIVESGNFVPSATYTLSGIGITTSQIVAPASGNWTLPNIPITATNIQLEFGSLPSTFENRPIGFELALCQRYYWRPITYAMGITYTVSFATSPIKFPVPMRAVPTMDSGAFFSTSGGNVGTPQLINSVGYRASVEQVTINNALSNWSVGVLVELTAGFSAEL